jgi:hypothetical protein
MSYEVQDRFENSVDCCRIVVIVWQSRVQMFVELYRFQLRMASRVAHPQALARATARLVACHKHFSPFGPAEILLQ